MSTVIAPMLNASLVLPATSVALTCTSPAAYTPSASVKLVPVPACQCAPPSLLYCQLAVSAAKVTSTWPSVVMPSTDDLPVSACRAAPGCTPVPYTTLFRSAPMLNASLVLPATSVALTCTSPAAYTPSASVKLVPVPACQCAPPSLLYCQLAVSAAKV